MTDEEMKEILESTIALQSQNAQYRTKRLPDARLVGPASTETISRLEEHVARLGTALPPSFRQFLRITDGIAHYMQLQSLSLRSAKVIVDSQSDDDEWDDFTPLHEFVIASGNTSGFVAFDHRRASETGEMPVIVVDGRGGKTEYRDFPEFLRFQLQLQKDALTMNRADRSNLPDD